MDMDLKYSYIVFFLEGFKKRYCENMIFLVIRIRFKKNLLLNIFVLLCWL